MDKYSVGDVIKFIKTRAGVEEESKGRVIEISIHNGHNIWKVDSYGTHLTLRENQILGIYKEKQGTMSVLIKNAIEEQNKDIVFVEVGSTVTVENLRDGTEKTYTITADNAECKGDGYVRSSKPLAIQLLNKYVNDEYELPGGEFRIIKIIPPIKSDKKTQVPISIVKKIANVANLDLGEKNDIVKSSYFKRQLVQAGPGTGKSFSLSHRVAHLIETQHLSPSEILVLSFSREAVAEVKRRLTKFEDNRILMVRPITIDSFVGSVLVRIPDIKLQSTSYEDSIAEAIKHLSKFKLGYFKHIFIDEVQDIVGIRAEFVLNLLKSLPSSCGYSLFGDFNQSIYDWTIKDDQLVAKTSSAEFKKIINTQVPDLSKTKLHKQFRSNIESPLKLETEALINDYEEGKIDNKVCFERWFKIMDGIPKITAGKIEKYSVGSDFFPSNQSKTAFLLRTNGQIIGEIDEALPKGTKVAQLGKYNKGILPAWVAQVLFRIKDESKIIDRDQLFKRVFAETEFKDSWELDEAFYLLKHIERGYDEKYFNLWHLKKNLTGIKDVPLSKYESDSIQKCGLTISTIHASKGLEFDSVVMLEPEGHSIGRLSSNEEILNEIKLFYVGLTRAKGTVKLIKNSSVASFFALANEANPDQITRWYKNYQNKRSLKFNVDAEEDVDGASFISDFGYDKPETIQDYISSSVKIGDEVEVIYMTSPLELKRFFILHNGHVIGCMSFGFYKSAFKISEKTGIRIRRFKSNIGKIYTEYRYDVYSDADADRTYVNDIGAWLALKLTGIAEV